MGFVIISHLKGHIQRLDGHYVCRCGFQRGTIIHSQANITLLKYTLRCIKIGLKTSRNGIS